MLSQKQQEAVCHLSGPCLCLAGPGSGKTTVLTRRIAHLIFQEGVLPEQILVITFTRAAAREMKERFENLSGESLPVVFGTFHSVFYGILCREAKGQPYQLLDTQRKYQVLKETAYACGVSVDHQQILEQLAAEMSFMKNTMQDPTSYRSADFPGENLGKVYEDFEERKRRYHYMDYDDMLSRTLTLLRENPPVLARWQKRFSYILIDEIQDMNRLQFLVIEKLALPENNLFVVGDDDQSIYGFRGAEPKLMLEFPGYYPDCKQILLGDNYRCASVIVEGAQNLIRYNTARFSKEITTRNEQPGEITYLACTQPREEAQRVVALLQQRHKDIPYEDMGVLYRNHRQCHPLAELCRQAGIPFYWKEPMPNPYTHWIMEDMAAYLALAAGSPERRDMLRILNKPDRGLARASLERPQVRFADWQQYYASQPWLRDSIRQLETDLLFLKKLSGKALVSFIQKKIGYETYLKKTAKDPKEWQQYQGIVASFEQVVAKAVNVRQALELWQEARDFFEAQNSLPVQERQGVGFFTLHGAKGLEFDTVFLLDCNESVIPSKKAVTREQVEEERRLFYVGITRAKSRLYLCYCTQDDGTKISPSRFLKEMQGAREKPQSGISSKVASSKSSSNRSSTASYSSSD
jgi:DNA helicase-2/ATP-dependent DNA helicase PcrA